MSGLAFVASTPPTSYWVNYCNGQKAMCHHAGTHRSLLPPNTQHSGQTQHRGTEEDRFVTCRSTSPHRTSARRLDSLTGAPVLQYARVVLVSTGHARYTKSISNHWIMAEMEISRTMLVW
jgi:hypothetical protein